MSTTANSRYDRPWKSFEEQLELLRSRGMRIDDEASALTWLRRVGYYRLSAYWYPFRVFKHVQDAETGLIGTQRTDEFVQDTCFSDAVELYVFDRRLRVLLSDALERVEVSLRVELAYRLGKSDTFAHLHADAFHPKFRERRFGSDGESAFDAWQRRYGGLVARSKEDFVKHYHERHGQDLPIWVAIEVWDFGAVSQLLAMTRVPDQQAIAQRFGIADWKAFSSWVRALSYLRNLVAHHCRVWNRNMVSEPKMPSAHPPDWCAHFAGKKDLLSKPFVYLEIARHLVEVVCPGSQWPQRMAAHLMAFPGQTSERKLTVGAMGVPNGWEHRWQSEQGK